VWGGQTSTQIAARFFAEPDLFGDFALIWAGRNNYGERITVESDIASMVSSLTTPNYLILGVINGNYPSEYKGHNWGYLTMTGLNSDLAATYGSRFIDMRTILVNSYNPSSSQDLIDFSHDVVPSSLRTDRVHLNAAGYAIVAQTVYTAYTSVTAVPLPSAIWLFGTGLGLLSFTRRKKSQNR